MAVSLMALGPFGMLASLGMMMFVLMFFFILVVYVYMALVFMTLAKKLKYNRPWLAWIPLANFFLIPILAKKEWPWGFIFLVPLVGAVFYFIWMWKIYERRKYPGWLSLIPLGGIVPFLGTLFFLANLIIIGLVAWMDR